jgi:hypothetical protein
MEAREHSRPIIRAEEIHSKISEHFLHLDNFSVSGYLFQNLQKAIRFVSRPWTMTPPTKAASGISAIQNQRTSFSESDSDIEDITPRFGRGGPQFDEHGKIKAENKSAGDKLRSGALVLLVWG